MSEYYNVCPKCGANLDPGEICDCCVEAAKHVSSFEEELRALLVIPEESGSQIEFPIPRRRSLWDMF